MLLINYFEWKGLQNDVILVEFTEDGLLFLEDSAALSLGAQPQWEAMWAGGESLTPGWELLPASDQVWRSEQVVL